MTTCAFVPGKFSIFGDCASCGEPFTSQTHHAAKAIGDVAHETHTTLVVTPFMDLNRFGSGKEARWEARIQFLLTQADSAKVVR